MTGRICYLYPSSCGALHVLDNILLNRIFFHFVQSLLVLSGSLSYDYSPKRQRNILMYYNTFCFRHKDNIVFFLSSRYFFDSSALWGPSDFRALQNLWRVHVFSEVVFYRGRGREGVNDLFYFTSLYKIILIIFINWVYKFLLQYWNF